MSCTVASSASSGLNRMVDSSKASSGIIGGMIEVSQWT